MPAALFASRRMVAVHSPAFQMLTLAIGRQASKEMLDGCA